MSLQIPEVLRRRLDLFVIESGLPREVVEEVVGHHTLVTYPKGARLFLQGSPADMVFCVVSGMVEVFCPLADGSRVMVRLCGPGEVIGHVDFVDHKQCRAQVFEAFARTKSEVALVTREHITKVLKTLDSEKLIGLLEYLNTMWSSQANSWATFIGLDYRSRLEIVLQDLGGRFGVEDARGTLLITELLHAKLAEMIGSSRPMITRLINDMVAQGILERSGKQYILLKKQPEQPSSVAQRPEPAATPARPISATRNPVSKRPPQSKRSSPKGSMGQTTGNSLFGASGTSRSPGLKS